MSDEDSPSYTDGEIVWVKLGSSWWPGEVNKGPDDLNTKKPPLVIVKFFNETSYEFVKNYNQIYPYNCERKNEFIKKGMDSFRANNVHMEKFPIDVSFAEVQTGGNPNIISDPAFLPTPKKPALAEGGSPKKTPKTSVTKARARTTSTKKNSSTKSPKLNITHRRFLGYDDYEAHVRVQYPGKDTEHLGEDDRISIPVEPQTKFPCSLCPFVTTRLEVMIVHVQAHGKPQPKPKARKRSPKKAPALAGRHVISEDDTANSSMQDSDDEVRRKQKRKKRPARPKPAKRAKEEIGAPEDVRTNLLAEWSDSGESSAKEEPAPTSSFAKSEQTNGQTEEGKSCFDFDDDEEDTAVIEAAIGRKIPRVLPATEKRKTPDNNGDASLPLAEDDANRIELLKGNDSSLSEKLGESSSNSLDLENDFNKLIESTSVAEIPDVLLSAVKSPLKLGKMEKKESEVATKLTNPKKRFVKSFEDFEMLQNEQRRAQEEKDKEEEAKLEKKKDEEGEKPTEEEVKSESEKVNSDSEEKPDEEKIKVDEKVDEKEREPKAKSRKITIKKLFLSPTRTTEKPESVVAEIVEKKAELVEEVKKEGLLKIAKLKNQLMSKIEDEDAKPARRSGRTPKAKIFEDFTSEEVLPPKKIMKVEKSDTPSVKKREKYVVKNKKFFHPNQITDDGSEEIEAETSTSKIKPETSKMAKKEFESPKVTKKELCYSQKLEKKELDSLKGTKKEILDSSKITNEPEISSMEAEVPVTKSSKKDTFKEVEIPVTKSPRRETLKDVETPVAKLPRKDTLKEVEFPVVKSQRKETLKEGEIQVEKSPKKETSKEVEIPVEKSPKKETLKEVEIPVAKSPKKETGSFSPKKDVKTSSSDSIDDYINTFLTDIEKTVPTTKESLENTSEEPLEELSEAPLEEPLEEPVKELPKELIEESITQPIEESIQEPIEEPIQEPIEEPLPESTIEDNLLESTQESKSSDNENSTDLDFEIKTDLTNLNKTEDEMSALTTLAMISEAIEPKPIESAESPVDSLEEEDPIIAAQKIALEEHFKQAELVEIDGNLTVVSEKELADAQVEITADISPSSKKPVTLTSFSMDFGESNSSGSSGIDKLTFDQIVNEKLTESPKKVSEVPKDDVADQKLASLVADLEDGIAQPLVEKPKAPPAASPSKLMERLTTPETSIKPKELIKPPKASPLLTKTTPLSGKTKFVIKSATTKMIKGTPTSSSKPIILSEKIIKPEVNANVSIQKVTQKRALPTADELDDIDTFIIQKTSKVESEDEAEPAGHWKKYKKSIEPKRHAVQAQQKAKVRQQSIGKAKILQQTIITPAGEIIQPGVSVSQADDAVFDINSMPIVLSDQILTPENIESMPFILSDGNEKVTVATSSVSTPKIQMHTQQVVKKVPHQQQMRLLNKSYGSGVGERARGLKTPKILGGAGMRAARPSPVATPAAAAGKYVLVSQPQASPVSQHTSKYTVGRRHPTAAAVARRAPNELGLVGSTATKLGTATESTGNKIMIVTNQQGQKHRVLLTPAQQKMMGYQTQGTRMKSYIKGAPVSEKKEVQLTSVATSSGILGKQRLTPAKQVITSSGLIIQSGPPTALQKPPTRIPTAQGTPVRKFQMQSQQVKAKQKTIIIKNQQGQTLRKIQGTDEALLQQQVAEQLEAIKASGVLQQKQEILNYKSATTAAVTTPIASKSARRSYAKKIAEHSPKPKLHHQQLLMAKSTESVVPPLAPISPQKSEHTAPIDKAEKERPLNQLVIQDAMGNQTTITEGQILALPSETVDGQAQSYMLVTLDESGNLTPLNNEALMSLDPNLALGGDLSNAVLQLDQSALEEAPEASTSAAPEAPDEPPEAPEEREPEPEEALAEPGQQLIVTGDPIAAQKFLESLTEGNTDLANILASAESSSILIHADGQQILINTDADNQMLLSMNSSDLSESTEGDGNPIFASQPKNQDILAAALADTDVFQQEQNGQKIVAQMSPNAGLYPMSVGNVLETSLTLNSPIMTPLEVPSGKKISEENDILSQVAKNVNLPITITDPTIAQTVAAQQQATLVDLQSNLELAITESSIVATSSMSSPSFSAFSLPSLDGDEGQKPFNSSMPLLSEEGDLEEAPVVDGGESVATTAFNRVGLCTLGNEMCAALSEPPHDMFDVSDTPDEEVREEERRETNEVREEEDRGVNEDSCEIPLQPGIIASLDMAAAADVVRPEGDGKREAEEGGEEVEAKKCKFD